jgi:hypothetical protein
MPPDTKQTVIGVDFGGNDRSTIAVCEVEGGQVRLVTHAVMRRGALQVRMCDIPPASRRRKSVRAIVAMNLELNLPRGGSGNRWRRRAGLPVIDPSKVGPFGGIKMSTGEIAKMIRTPISDEEKRTGPTG